MPVTSEPHLYKEEVANADVAAQNLYEDTANEVHIEISRTLESQVDRGIRRAGSSQSMIYHLN